MNESRDEEGEGRERRVETKPNDYAYPSFEPLHPRLATRIELIQGAKLNTRILIIAEEEGAIQENSRHANFPLLFLLLRTFSTAEKYFYIPLLRRMNYPSLVNEYAQAKSPFHDRTAAKTHAAKG